MPKGVVSKKQQGSGGKKNTKKKDDFDQVLAEAAAIVSQRQVVASGSNGGGGNRQQQQLQTFLNSARAIDEKIRKGETKQQREDREKKEIVLRRELYMRYEAQKQAEREQQAQYNNYVHEQKLQYENTFIPLEKEDGEWQELCPGKWIRMEQFNDDNDMSSITDMFAKSLSEPYTAFTYMHFMFGWKDLCIMLMGLEQKEKPSAATRGELIGCVVSRVTRLKSGSYEPFGYVAMLAVDPAFRGHKLGQRLVLKSIELMKKKDCVCVQLETPVTNDRALELYTGLGFVKTKYLVRYYMDGSDAVRLRLFTKPWTHDMIQLIDDDQ